MTVIFQIIVREFEFVIQQPNLVADEIMAASHPGNPLSMIWRDMKTAGLVALTVTLFLFGAGDANAQTAAKVADGDFETTRLTSNYKHNPEVGPGQPWIFTGHSGLARISSEGFHVPGPSTGQCGFLQSPNSSFSQSVHFPTAGEFILSYALAGRDSFEKPKWGGNLDYIVLIVPSGGDKPILHVADSTTNSQPFKMIAHRFSVPTAGDYTLIFKGAPGPPHDDTALFDNIIIAVEPQRAAR